MYSKGKYVVGEVIGRYIPVMAAVCVNESITHSDLAPIFVPGSIRSAGFFHINEDLTVSVYGDSISLRVKSQENDAILVSKTLALPGTVRSGGSMMRATCMVSVEPPETGFPAAIH